MADRDALDVGLLIDGARQCATQPSARCWPTWRRPASGASLVHLRWSTTASRRACLLMASDK
jgi:hypothetical protein